MAGAHGVLFGAAFLILVAFPSHFDTSSSPYKNRRLFSVCSRNIWSMKREDGEKPSRWSPLCPGTNRYIPLLSSIDCGKGGGEDDPGVRRPAALEPSRVSRPWNRGAPTSTVQAGLDVLSHLLMGGTRLPGRKPACPIPRRYSGRRDAVCSASVRRLIILVLSRSRCS